MQKLQPYISSILLSIGIWCGGEAAQPLCKLRIAWAALPDESLPSVPLGTAMPPAMTIPVAPVEASYRLGTGDRILVSLLNVPEYSGEQLVSLDGSVNLPLVGKIFVAGLTVEEAQSIIAKRYEPELRFSIVRINLLQARPMQIIVTGEAQRPGPYVMNLGTNAQVPTITQAIQVAGGLTQSADLRQVLVHRQQAGNIQTITVNLQALLEKGDASQNIALRDGDSITIAPTQDINIAETAQLASSSLAADPNTVLDIAVVGEVFRPGAYKIGVGQNIPSGQVATLTGGINPPGGTVSRPTITSALQQAGGVKPSADLRQIQVRRVTRSGKEQLINLDFWKLLQGGDLSQNLVLKQGDTVIIPLADEITPGESSQLASANLSPGTIRINFVGEFKQVDARPGPQTATVDFPASTTLSQAILAIGGLNERAKKEVELVRLNPNGTISRRVVKIDLRKGIDSDSNPILWNNDVIIVETSNSARINDQINKVLSPLLKILAPLRSLTR
jgi:protein involved in polysaccharide export with SLBB domain